MSQLDEYKVDKNLCIDCNACYTTYPEIFKQVPWQGETKAEAHTPIELGKYNPWDVIGVCPTDAISKLGEMPEKPEASGAEELKPLEDQGPWEDRWALVKDEPESKWEVMKRYGMAAVLDEEKDRYVMKMQFPEACPRHIKAYQMGLPSTMPDYDWSADLSDDGLILTVVGKLADGHFKKLTGMINSFPDRFRRQFHFANRVELRRKSYRSKTLVVEMTKVADH